MRFKILPLTVLVIALAAVSASAAIRYVDVHSANPAPPYATWSTAAATIQDAVDAAASGDQVLVTNGVYQTGETLVPAALTSNRVAVTKAILVQSVNGATMTTIQGIREPYPASDKAVRCVYLASGARLEGFTLTNGFGSDGGGVFCESPSAVVSNCVLTGNSAGGGGGASGGTLYNCTLRGNSAHWVGGGASRATLYHCTLEGNSAFEFGGGAVASTLYHSTLSGNSAEWGGGGAMQGTLINCEVTGNSAGSGGGASGAHLQNCTVSGNSASESGGGVKGGTLANCIVYYNSAPESANYLEADISSGETNILYFSCTHSCTLPLPSEGTGNLTNAPRFLDQAGGNLRLQPGSPCINAGSNAFAPADTDLDGNPRIAGDTVDMGAYELELPQSLTLRAWLQQYALTTDGSADDLDADGDGLSNLQEWRAGTNPTNALSVLRLLGVASGAHGPIVSWQSVSGLKYYLDRATDLGALAPFSPSATNIIGQPEITTFTDTNAVGTGPFFYRVGVRD